MNKVSYDTIRIRSKEGSLIATFRAPEGNVTDILNKRLLLAVSEGVLLKNGLVRIVAEDKTSLAKVLHWVKVDSQWKSLLPKLKIQFRD